MRRVIRSMRLVLIQADSSSLVMRGPKEPAGADKPAATMPRCSAGHDLKLDRRRLPQERFEIGVGRGPGDFHAVAKLGGGRDGIRRWLAQDVRDDHLRRFLGVALGQQARRGDLVDQRMGVGGPVLSGGVPHRDLPKVAGGDPGR